jgi:hypothetical protein
MKYHQCTKWENRFSITSEVRVWNLPSFLLSPFQGPTTQLKLFSYVRCPRCGHEEYDPQSSFSGSFLRQRSPFRECGRVAGGADMAT